MFWSEHKKLAWQSVGARYVQVGMQVSCVGSHMQNESARQVAGLLYLIEQRVLHCGVLVKSHSHVGFAAQVVGSVF